MEQKINIRNEIKSEIAKSGWTLTDIVKEMNRLHPAEHQTTSQNISNKLTRGTLKYSEAKEIANIIGRKIEWLPIDERMERESVLSAPELTKPTPPQQSSTAAPKQEKQYKPFTEADEQQIDFPKLLASIQYQMEIADTFGMDVLNTLMEKARQQEEKKTE